MAKDPFDDPKKTNVKALRAFRLKGEAIVVGEVIPKAFFAKKGDWQTLCNMTPPKAEETSDPVGKPKATAEATGDDEGAKKPASTKKAAAGGGLPSA